jgi:hypothetical protein
MEACESDIFKAKLLKGLCVLNKPDDSADMGRASTEKRGAHYALWAGKIEASYHQSINLKLDPGQS